ncbi:hypothetical protein PSP6_690003 [Paraburkholderia tropica]|uniref:hypothetical protein n=1 Tax=Paraburkholderia tropica TaxID=92647 RepID=UPI001CB57B3D|nr:hypothetical protein [Paraburkholderia tropica]CAG9235582.1 hypothetical protein PSP6_690003 [Paraburkholderia tropica]
MQTNKHIEIVSRSAGNGIVVSPYVGSDIRDIAAAMVELAKAEGVAVQCDMNGIKLHADDSSAAESIYKSYRDEVERRAAAWRESPEGRAVQAERERREAANVGALRELLAELPTQIGTESGLVAWVGRLALLDRADFDTQAVADQLEAAGYVRSEFVGDKNPTPSKSHVARWIIGQAIDCLRKKHGVHSVLSMHAEKYATANT